MENMKVQLRRLGLGHDKRRSFATIDPEYYKWTQWIFLQIFNSWYDDEAKQARPIAELVERFENGTREIPGTTRAWSELSATERADVLGEYRLAYASDAPVNWCPGLGTVLANEEVTADGRSERGNFPVFKSKLRQWNMRITAYADRLLDDLDALDWPEAIKLQQRNWIGRSEGARVDFQVGEAGAITVFTTRQDTLFGATYMVLAPEHDLVEKIVPAAWPEGTHDVWTGGHATPAEAVDAYRKQAASKSDVERQAEAKDKTGVFTGAYATNPVSGERVPVFIADYVLMGYGTGAIMAVPAHDSRDFAFARAFELPMRCVVQPSDGRGTDPSTWDDAFSPTRRSWWTPPTTRSPWTAWASPPPRRGSPPGWPTAASARAPSTSGCATGCSAASGTGASLPDRLRRGRRRPLPARVDAAAGAARGRGLLAAHLRPGRRGHPPGDPAVPQRGLGERHPGPGRRPQEVPPRDQHHAQLGRFLLVRAALPGPAQLREAGGPGRRAVLDGPPRGHADRWRRPVRRRRRARRAAPAVRALLVQGPVRPGPRLLGRTLPQAVQPGHDPGLRLPGRAGSPYRRPRSRSATAASGTRARRSPASWARWASP